MNENKYRHWHGWRKISLSVWLFVLALVSIFIFVPGEHLSYNMLAIGDGEYWRLISASLNHLSWTHLLLNITGFVLLVLIFPEYFGTIQWLMRLLMIMLLTNLIILAVFTDSVVFSGLSGALHGLIYSVARANIGQLRGQLLLILLIAKLALEQFYGDGLTTDLLGEGQVFYDSHLCGVLAAVLVSTLERFTGASRKERGQD